MKIKYFLSLFILSLTAASAAFVFAQDQNESAIQYPVEELNGCKDKQDCKAYCDKKENMEACLAFAEENKIMSEEEIKLAKNFLKTGSSGPGGCTGKGSCKEYCNDIDNIDECVSYAEENGLMPKEQLQEAKKVQAAIAKGIKPPACGNKEDCDAYCESSEHMEECIAFGEAAGFLQGKELENAQKMLTAIKKGVQAPPCKGKEACDEYCNDPDNMELCMNFAIEAGFMSEEEKANSQKMLQALKNGAVPPKCKGKEECDIYCSQKENVEECIAFSEAAGFMSAEDAAMARKTGGKGPGGCAGKEECENFCNNPDNQETCLNFAKENGMNEEGKVPFTVQGPGGCKSMEECQTYCQTNPEACANFQAPNSEPLGEENSIPFQQAQQEQLQQQPGPGGCQSPEECQAYCQSNPQECVNFQSSTQGSPEGQGSMPNQQMNNLNPIMPAQTGPGGCQSAEECQAYCSANPQACANFQAPVQMQQNAPSNQSNMQPPAEQNYVPPQQPIPFENQQPPAENFPGQPSGLIKPASLLGSIIQAFRNFFSY